MAVLIDELQYFTLTELAALIMAMHNSAAASTSAGVAGSRSPILPGLAGVEILCRAALQLPGYWGAGGGHGEGTSRTSPCRRGLIRAESPEGNLSTHKGVPVLSSGWGYQAWNLATSSPISLEVVKNATTTVIPRLDNNFFRVRFDRLTPSEKNFLRAMAELGPEAHRTGDIADILRVKVTSLGPVRAKLIRKGMVFSPAHGDMAFTVPLFDEFMRRAMPAFRP